MINNIEKQIMATKESIYIQKIGDSICDLLVKNVSIRACTEKIN